MTDTQKKVAKRLRWLMTKDGSGRLSSRNEYEKLTEGELAAFNLACELQEQLDDHIEVICKQDDYLDAAGITHPEELKCMVSLRRIFTQRVKPLVGGIKVRHVSQQEWVATAIAHLTRKE